GEWGIDRLIFIKDVEADKRDSELKEFLDKHSDVLTGLTDNRFTSTDELCERIQFSIERWIERQFGSRGSASAVPVTSPDDIPRRPRKFIGRDALKAEAVYKLENDGLLLLQGFGGAGKTALAAEVMAERMARGQTPALWLEAGSSDIEVLTE